MTFVSPGPSSPRPSGTETLGYKTPTPIQAQAIRGARWPRLDGCRTLKPVPARLPDSPCPSCKTQHLRRKVGSNAIRVLVLVPTRELAEQVHASFRQYGEHLPSALTLPTVASASICK